MKAGRSPSSPASPPPPRLDFPGHGVIVASRMREFADRLLRAGILFVLIWVVLGVSTMVSCRQVRGSEMSPVLDPGGWEFMAPVSGEDGLSAGQVVHFHQDPLGGVQQETFTSRIEAKEGESIEISSALSTILGHDPKDTVKLIVPRDCVVLLAENKGQRNVDSRNFGPIRVWAIDARTR